MASKVSCQPLAQRRGKRRLDVAIHHVDQGKNFEARRRGLAKRLNVFASRAFLRRELASATSAILHFPRAGIR